MVEDTKLALAVIGVRGVTFLRVTGRSQQKGKIKARETGGSLNRNLWMQLGNIWSNEKSPDAGTGGAGSSFHTDIELASVFLPKRLLIIVTSDQQVNPIVQAIVNANQTGRHGDGRIFICPIISAIRVRTGENGNVALS